jgi:carbon-monoxide dehydrogenase medium subunit
MKPAPFDYVRPGNLAEVLALLATPDAKPIAGGQSLVPLLALRMAAPKLLVDIANLAELKGITFNGGHIRIGALTRWCDVLNHPELRARHPLLVEAISHTAHYQIRNRGTVGGSCAHADPAAEMPAIAMTCDAEFEVASAQGQRTIPASEFFAGVLTTALEPEELLVAVRLPTWPTARRFGFQEFARRTGDFAIAGCAVFWDDVDGRCNGTHVGVFGVGETPLRLSAVEAVLNNRAISPKVIAEAAATLRKAVTPQDDIHASGAYRNALLAVLLERALLSASSPREKTVA